MRTMWTIEKVKDFVESNSDCELMDDIYINQSTYMKFKCACGEEFHTTFKQFKKDKRQCDKCSKINFSKKRLQKFDIIKKFIESKKNCKLISTEYKGAHEDLEIQCHCGEIFKVSYNQFQSQQKYQCNNCSKEIVKEKTKNNFSDICNLFLEKGYIPMFNENDYLKNSTKLTAIDKEGYKIFINHANLSQDVIPRIFDINNPYTIENINHYLKVNNINYKLLSREYLGNGNENKLSWICDKDHNFDMCWNSFQSGQRCPECSVICGKNHYMWKGGITSLRKYLRDSIYKWKIDSLKKYNYKCVITSKSSDIIHHLYGFEQIFNETIYNSKLPIYDNIEKYSMEELRLLKKICLELHYKYGLGVCLSENIHKEFHGIYGYGNNTPEQFEEFKSRYTRKLFQR